MWGRGTTRPMIFAQRNYWNRPLSLALAGVTLAWGGLANAGAPGQPGTQGTECVASSTSDAAAVQAAAKTAAQEKLSSMAPVYRLMYADIQYQINVGEANVKGDTAQVKGSITVQGKQRLTGKVMAQTFKGVVQLNRDGCAWKATSYQQA